MASNRQLGERYAQTITDHDLSGFGELLHPSPCNARSRPRTNSNHQPSRAGASLCTGVGNSERTGDMFSKGDELYDKRFGERYLVLAAARDSGGEWLLVEPGARHLPRNAGDGELRFLAEMRPAGRFEEFLAEIPRSTTADVRGSPTF
jgi:hypothetical protein